MMSFRRWGMLSVCLTVMFCFAATGLTQEIQSPVGAKHVILIGYDGFGGHYVHWDELPNLTKLRDGGAWTLKMRCVLPSVSAINWETMLSGADSELHGYRTWGSKTPDLPSRILTENGRFPDIFYAIKKSYPESSLYCAYSWNGIGYLFDKSVVNEEVSTGARTDSVFDYNGRERKKEDGTMEAVSYPNDEEVCDLGLKFIAKNPTFTFLYFSEPDGVGHSIGWGTPQYYATVQKLDVMLGRLIDELEAGDRFKDTVLIFVSDHGGTDKGHGGEIMEHMEVPFIAYGCGIQPGEIEDVVINYDVAATIAWILGVDAPQAWRGKPVTAAFGK